MVLPLLLPRIRRRLPRPSTPGRADQGDRAGRGAGHRSGGAAGDKRCSMIPVVAIRRGEYGDAVVSALPAPARGKLHWIPW